MDMNDNITINVNSRAYKPHSVDLDMSPDGNLITASAYIDPRWELMQPVRSNAYTNAANRIKEYVNNSYGCYKSESDMYKENNRLRITKVVFSPPATIVFWSDNTKTVVKADYRYEQYDPEKGIAMAVAKKMLGDNKGKYYDIFKYWKKKYEEQQTLEKKESSNIEELNFLEDLLP